jgi:hypothetical protein
VIRAIALAALLLGAAGCTRDGLRGAYVGGGGGVTLSSP